MAGTVQLSWRDLRLAAMYELLHACEALRAAGAIDRYSPVLTDLGDDTTDGFALLRGDAGRLRALAAGDELRPWVERYGLRIALW
jgi:hypothetical protein